MWVVGRETIVQLFCLYTSFVPRCKRNAAAVRSCMPSTQSNGAVLYVLALSNVYCSLLEGPPIAEHFIDALAAQRAGWQELCFSLMTSRTFEQLYLKFWRNIQYWSVFEKYTYLRSPLNSHLIAIRPY